MHFIDIYTILQIQQRSLKKKETYFGDSLW